jgi:transcriptional regulator of met regulon
VGDHKDRTPTITEVAQHVVDGASCLKIDPDCRLVEKQQLGFSDQRNGDVDPPLQTTREGCSYRVRDWTEERNIKETINRLTAQVHVEKSREDLKVLTDCETRKYGDALRHMTNQTKDLSVLARILQSCPDTDAAARQWQLTA